MGIESDAFLLLPDEAYGTGLRQKLMRQRVPFLAVGLVGDPARLEHEPAKLNFFFASDAEDRDAGFYVKIDVQAQLVQFHEKDTGYRRGVLSEQLTRARSAKIQSVCPPLNLLS